MKGKFIPKSREKMSHTPVKKIPRPGSTRNKIPRPGPTRNKIPRPDPTRKYSLKCSPTPDRFRSGPVRSGETRGFGLPRRSLLQIVLFWFNQRNPTFLNKFHRNSKWYGIMGSLKENRVLLLYPLQHYHIHYCNASVTQCLSMTWSW